MHKICYWIVDSFLVAFISFLSATLALDHITLTGVYIGAGMGCLAGFINFKRFWETQTNKSLRCVKIGIFL